MSIARIYTHQYNTVSGQLFGFLNAKTFKVDKRRTLSSVKRSRSFVEFTLTHGETSYIKKKNHLTVKPSSGGPGETSNDEQSVSQVGGFVGEEQIPLTEPEMQPIIMMTSHIKAVSEQLTYSTIAELSHLCFDSFQCKPSLLYKWLFSHSNNFSRAWRVCKKSK